MKNLLVFAAPGRLVSSPSGPSSRNRCRGWAIPDRLLRVRLLVNDAMDAPAESPATPTSDIGQWHLGELSVPLAIGIGSSLLVLAVIGAAFLAGLQLASVDRSVRRHEPDLHALAKARCRRRARLRIGGIRFFVPFCRRSGRAHPDLTLVRQS